MSQRTPNLSPEPDAGTRLSPCTQTSFDSLLRARLSRRSALRGGAGLGAGALLGPLALTACGGGSDEPDTDPPAPDTPAVPLGFESVAKGFQDRLTVPEGYEVSVLHALGDPLEWGDAPWGDEGKESASSYERRIGDGHNGLYYFGLSGDGRWDPNRSEHGLLCVSHEYVGNPSFLHPRGRTLVNGKRPASEVDKEILAQGLSVVEVRRQAGSTRMEMVRGSPYNRRITSATEIDFAGPAAGHALLRNRLSPHGTRAYGLSHNGAGGYTPWGTYLSGERNHLRTMGRAAGDDALRSAAEVTALRRYGLPEGSPNPSGWDSPDGERYRRWNSSVSASSAGQDHRHAFNTFGWVLEVDPFRPNNAPVKRTALGRLNHAGAWVAPAVAGQPIVIYLADGLAYEYVYKVVSDASWNPADTHGGTDAGAKYLNRGTLYVARFNEDGSGQWLPLTHGRNGLDASHATYPFADQGDVLIHCRLAADALGATPMDSPGWGLVNPRNGDVYMAMRSNAERRADTLNAANPRLNRRNGHILRWRERGGHSGTRLEWDVYLFAARANGRQGENLSGLDDAQDFSCPESLYFDQRADSADGLQASAQGLLWIGTSDRHGDDGSNSMLMAAVPGQVDDGRTVTTRDGQRTRMGAKPTADTLRRFAVGPFDSTITGVQITPDGKTLLLNVRHPGEGGAGDFGTGKYSSHWPGAQPGVEATYGAHRRPRSATVAIFRSDGGPVGL